MSRLHDKNLFDFIRAEMTFFKPYLIKMTGASPRSFDWVGDGFRLGGRIQVSQNHLSQNSDFSSDFARFILKLLEELKKR